MPARAWMRFEHPTLDKLSRRAFDDAVDDAILDAIAAGSTESERLAQSYGF